MKNQEKINGTKPPSWMEQVEKAELNSIRKLYLEAWKKIEEIDEEYRKRLKDVPLVIVGTGGEDTDYEWKNVFYKPEDYNIIEEEDGK